MSNIVYFAGVATAVDASQSSPFLLLADRYIPLDSMTPIAQRATFNAWLAIIYLNRSDAVRFRKGVSAKEVPSLVLEFRRDYEAGAWRKLGRGKTLEECLLMFECTSGEEFLCLVSSAFPLQPMERIQYKLILSPQAMLDLAVVYYRHKHKARVGHRPWPTLTYDGRTGHCITLSDADWEGTKFAYQDPWPGRSLLCEENNVAGVKAFPLSYGKMHFPTGIVDVTSWGVTRDELSQVLYSIMLPGTMWFELEEVLREGTANQIFEGLQQQSLQELVGAMSTLAAPSPYDPYSFDG